jgi:hypothetical protein
MEHASEDLRGYARGELGPERTREVEEHLRGCAECRSELVAARALTASEPEPMNDLERARLRQGIQAAVSPAGAVSKSRGPRRLYAALGAAALIAVAVVGGYFGLQDGLGLSGDDAEGGGGNEGATAESAPDQLTEDSDNLLRALRFDRDLGRVNEERLRALGERGPDQPVRPVASGNAEERKRVLADLSGGLVQKAPAKVRGQVEECIASVEGTSGSLSPVPYYGALAELDGREVLVLSFAWDGSSDDKDELDSYMIYAWPRGGGCDFPVMYQAGSFTK